MSNPLQRSNPEIVCTMGMHRAGTSVTSRVLNLLGVYLGPEAGFFTPRKDNNAKGFYENRAMTKLNQHVFRMTGGTWLDPPLLPEGWESDPALDPLKERARTLVRDTFGDAPLWGWKDPRSCLTSPFWQTVLPEMRYVICVRNPIDVAASLRKRNDLPFERSCRAWLRYVASSIYNTAGKPRIFVFFEEYFRDWKAQVRRLADFIGRPEQAEQPAVEELVRGWLELNLWHHRTEPLESIRHPDVPLEAKSLYLALLVGFGSGKDGSPEPQAAHAALDLYARSLEATLGWNARQPERSPR
jgi:hypothetical protein